MQGAGSVLLMTAPLSMADRCDTTQHATQSLLISNAACASTQQAMHPLSLACKFHTQAEELLARFAWSRYAVACSPAPDLRLVVVYGAEDLAG